MDPFDTFEVTVTVKVKLTMTVKLIIRLIVPWDLFAEKAVSVNQ